jgi:hypothetical protein
VGLNRSFLAGLALGILLMGCAGASFPTKYYVLDAVDYNKDGRLLGPSEIEDLSFDRCQPSVSNLHPCVVVFTSDFLALKQDYLDTKNKLISCEHGK